ncbi:MAG: bifunctional adenosylcobinamide kinase/adenosylcobinamide-phosphate guanylyltransferase [Deltaproteobacteria bacterium]|nr:MAG: bifunctional adenosylcobinamide kinase/adenosylcobinamide-phosphate guanylyltransferase [Deltaproteobacteria bacterium]
MSMSAEQTVPVTLVLGGAASGKSRFAQGLAECRPGPLLYVATAQAGDDEMAGRIARHRQARGERWRTLEAPLDLTVLATAAAGHGAVLVDCATLWLTNLLLAGGSAEAVWPAVEAFIATFDRLPAPLILVSNEVGQGIVPEHALARAFRDLAGQVNQRLAARADRVWLVAAGLPLALK